MEEAAFESASSQGAEPEMNIRVLFPAGIEQTPTHKILLF
jgi:hypothetical protein